MSQTVTGTPAFLSSSRALRRVFLVNPGPLTTHRVGQLVAELRQVPLDDELSSIVVTLLFHLAARKEVVAQATHTQTLWTRVEKPIAHKCFGCEEYPQPGQEWTTDGAPCPECVSDCDACYVAAQSKSECIHNGVFSRAHNLPSWCGHCNRWVPACDL